MTTLTSRPSSEVSSQFDDAIAHMHEQERDCTEKFAELNAMRAETQQSAVDTAVLLGEVLIKIGDKFIGSDGRDMVIKKVSADGSVAMGGYANNESNPLDLSTPQAPWVADPILTSELTKEQA